VGEGARLASLSTPVLRSTSGTEFDCGSSLPGALGKDRHKVLGILALTFLLADQPALEVSLQEVATPAQAAFEPRKESYEVGTGDVLNVLVMEHPELSRSAPILADGTIMLPLLRDVRVHGMTVLEIQRKLENLLENDYLVKPQVEVTVTSYQSSYVIVTGEVNVPGRRLLRGRTRLLDLLIDSGGLRPSASGEIVITRTQGNSDGGLDTIRLALGRGAITAKDRETLEFPLRNADFVSVRPRKYARIDGEVARPGRYAIEGQLDALVAAAGGLTRFANSRIQVQRTDHETGETKLLEADLKAIRSGASPDLEIQAGDVISVPRRRF
jgi:polysaccharide biosynthesis/export protein